MKNFIQCEPMNTFNLDDFKTRLSLRAEQPGWSLNRIAKETGVQYGSLWRFVKDENYKSLSGQNIEKLWPLLYPVATEQNQEDFTSDNGA